MERMGWSYAILLRTWEFGFNADALINIFASVPQDLADVLKTGFASLDIIQNKKCAADRVQSSNLAAGGGGGGGGAEDFLPRAGGGSCYFDDMEDRLWDRRRDCGYLRLDFEPRSQRRRHAFLNTHFSNLIGLHKEETLARIANREMPLPMTEVRPPQAAPTSSPLLPPPRPPGPPIPQNGRRGRRNGARARAPAPPRLAERFLR